MLIESEDDYFSSHNFSEIFQERRHPCPRSQEAGGPVTFSMLKY
jgi:hypothetical protein